jgi:hypothetical protein
MLPDMPPLAMPPDVPPLAMPPLDMLPDMPPLDVPPLAMPPLDMPPDDCGLPVCGCELLAGFDEQAEKPATRATLPSEQPKQRSFLRILRF